MTAPASPSHEVPWWLPIVYTSFGAILAFGFTRFQTWLDERASRKAFLKAVRAELQTINQHLQGTLKDTTQSKEEFDSGKRNLLHLATSFQTGIYDSQINKLKSVADPLVIQIVQFYDKLSNLEKVKSHFTGVSFELSGISTDPAEDARVIPLVQKYYSALNEIIKRINELLPIISGLIVRLQQID